VTGSASPPPPPKLIDYFSSFTLHIVEFLSFIRKAVREVIVAGQGVPCPLCKRNSNQTLRQRQFITNELSTSTKLQQRTGLVTTVQLVGCPFETFGTL